MCRVQARDAVVAARELARTEAILPGASGGAVLSAVAGKMSSFEPDAEVVVLIHDGGMAYLPTIYNDEWVATNLTEGATP